MHRRRSACPAARPAMPQGRPSARRPRARRYRPSTRRSPTSAKRKSASTNARVESGFPARSRFAPAAPRASRPRLSLNPRASSSITTLPIGSRVSTRMHCVAAPQLAVLRLEAIGVDERLLVPDGSLAGSRVSPPMALRVVDAVPPRSCPGARTSPTTPACCAAVEVEQLERELPQLGRRGVQSSRFAGRPPMSCAGTAQPRFGLGVSLRRSLLAPPALRPPPTATLLPAAVRSSQSRSCLRRSTSSWL